MKKHRNFLVSFIASIAVLGTISSVSAHAVVYFNDKTYMDSILENSYMIPPNDGFLCRNDNDIYQNRRMYITETGYDDEHIGYVICSIPGQRADSIRANIYGNIDSDAFGKSLAEICPDAEKIRFNSFTEANDYWELYIAGFDGRISYDEARKKDLTCEQVHRVKDLLDSVGEVQEFNYTMVPVTYEESASTFITVYDIRENGVNNLKLITNYITDNNLPCHIDENPKGRTFYVVPDEEITIAERYNLAKMIYSDLNIYPNIEYLDTVELLSEDITIDLQNNIEGDANNDGIFSLSDAVSLMEAVCYPNEYVLTPQGKFNADIAGDYDGITNMDTLAILKKLLNLE